MINQIRSRVERYCSEPIENIENYEEAVNDKTQTWHCHHRLEIQGQFKNSRELLKRCGMYYNVPASQLIFLTPSEHSRLHTDDKNHPFYGKSHTKETRDKMSASQKGLKRSETTRSRISKARMGKQTVLGRYWYNNGKVEILANECPSGFVIGRLPGKHWYNNGVVSVMANECPSGFVKGRKLTCL